MSAVRTALGGALLAAAVAVSVPAPAGAGVQFSRLTAEDGRLAFLALADTVLPADTLVVDYETFLPVWGGGPVRGLATGDSDTLYVATLLEAAALVNGRRVGAHRFQRPLTRNLEPDPRNWPPADPPLPAGLRGPAVRGLVQPFPERYIPLADGHLLFLTDAEYPIKPTLRLHDLHARFPDGVEWLVGRNLEVYDWVVGQDSLRWALAVRAHRPDYGGEVREVVLAGMDGTSQTFEVGSVTALTWGPLGSLWVLNSEGRLHCIVPQSGAWENREVAVSGVRPPQSLAPPESLWTWTLKNPYPEQLSAARQLWRAGESDDSPPAGWVVADDGGFRPCWGGFLSRRSLEASTAVPPFPSAVVDRVPVDRSRFLGPYAQLRLGRPRGEASLRNTAAGGEVASELWWRFAGNPTWVRVAGPWSTRLTPGELTPSNHSP